MHVCAGRSLAAPVMQDSSSTHRPFLLPLPSARGAVPATPGPVLPACGPSCFLPNCYAAEGCVTVIVLAVQDQAQSESKGTFQPWCIQNTMMLRSSKPASRSAGTQAFSTMGGGPHTRQMVPPPLPSAPSPPPP